MTAPAARPVAGANFRAVAAMPLEGAKRRKVLALVAAFTDGGEPTPSVHALADRLGWHVAKVDALVRRLEQDGFVTVEKRRRGKRSRGRRFRLAQPATPEHDKNADRVGAAAS